MQQPGLPESKLPLTTHKQRRVRLATTAITPLGTHSRPAAAALFWCTQLPREEALVT